MAAVPQREDCNTAMNEESCLTAVMRNRPDNIAEGTDVNKYFYK